MKHLRGFTLIELMIVVAIVAILAAISITVYMGSVAKSQITEGITIADSMKTAVSEYQHETGTCPSAGVGGILPPASYSGRFVSSATVTPGASGSCVITSLMKSNSVSPLIQGKTISLTMMPGGGGTAQWKCSSTASAAYLPKTCQ